MPEKYIPTNPNDDSNLKWYKQQAREDVDQVIDEFKSIVEMLEDYKTQAFYDYDEVDVEHFLEALDEFAQDVGLQNVKATLREYIEYFLNQ